MSYTKKLPIEEIPIQLIRSKQQFDKIESESTFFPKYRVPSAFQEDQSQNQQQLALPISIVEPVIKRKNKKQVPLNYLRFPYPLGPTKKQYQLTDIDKKFIEQHQEQFVYDNQYILNEDFLRKAIIFLETYEGRHQQQNPSISWLQGFTEEINCQLSETLLQRKIQKLVFNYWYLRRKEFQFSLYRPNWYVLKQTPFLVRYFQKIKKKSQNHHRVAESIKYEQMEDLVEEFELASIICQKVMKREELKLKKTLNMLKYFANSTKGLLNVQFEEEFPIVHIPSTLKDEVNIKVQNNQKQSDDKDVTL